MQPSNPPTQPLSTPPQPEVPQNTTVSPPPPVQKSSKKRIFLIALAIFTTLIVVGGTVAFITTKKTVSTANDFTAALVKKDFTKAYDFFAPELKKQQSLDQFRNVFTNAPFDSSCKLNVTNREASTGNGTGTQKKITGAIKCGSTSYPTELTFVSRNGTEKIFAYDVRPAEN